MYISDMKMRTETLDTSTCNSNVHDCVNVRLSSNDLVTDNYVSIDMDGQ